MQVCWRRFTKGNRTCRFGSSAYRKTTVGTSWHIYEHCRNRADEILSVG